MLAVSNTSPVSNLAIIGRLEFLQRRYGTVSIPPSVAKELEALTHPEGSRRIAAARVAGWLRIQTGATIPTLPAPLDPGEAEAIALAL